MHRGARLAAVAALAWAGCGGEAPAGLELSFASAGLLADADHVAVSFFTGEPTCEALLAGGQRPTPAFGPYGVGLNAASRADGARLRLTEIPVGVYAVLAEAIAADGVRVGRGCAEAQRVFDRQVSSIRIVISEG